MVVQLILCCMKGQYLKVIQQKSIMAATREREEDLTILANPLRTSESAL